MSTKTDRRERRYRLWIGLALGALLLTAPPAAAQDRPPLDIRVFAKIGLPGQPEPIAVGPDGRVYVGTNQLGHGDTDAPSKIFAFSAAGELREEYVLEGQPLDRSHGIQGLAFDRDGLLYALDRSADPRVVVLDPATGRQRLYASFRDVPPCSGAPDGNCSYDVADSPAGPDYAVFSPDGDLYVTDIDQALIWRVPAGGGEAEVWFTDPRLESVYGPNGIQFMADGRTLLFVNTASNPFGGNPATGRLYTLSVQADGSPGALTQVWESRPVDAPDGIAIALSGNVYVALAGSNQVLLLSPGFGELARVPSDPLANEALEVPLDGPGSLAFLDDRLLVSNHSPIRGDPASWAILDVFAGELGLPLYYPRIFRPELKLELLAARVLKSGRLRLRVRVTRDVAANTLAVSGVKLRARGERARSNERGIGRLVVRPRNSRPIAIKAHKDGFDDAKLKVPPGAPG